MEILEQEVRYLKGVGEARAKALNRLGIYSVRDLLNHFPRAYEDRTQFFTIRDAPTEEAVCIRAYVTAPPVLTVVRGGKRLVKLRAADESGSVDIAYFNMPYIREQLHAGERYLFYGKLTGTDGSMLDTYGGEFEWDFYTVCLWASRGADNGVRIVYGKNLVDFKMEKSIEDVITGVHPYWKNSESGDVVELTEKVVTLDDTDYPYEKITVLDCSSEFEEQPDEDELRSYVENYLKSTSCTEPSIDIDIDFAQLWQTPGYEDIAEAERVSLCDTVHVYISKLGIEATATVTETEYDTLLERYKSITLSNSSLSSRNNSLSNTLATTSQVEKAVSASSSAIILTVGTCSVTIEVRPRYRKRRLSLSE